MQRAFGLSLTKSLKHRAADEMGKFLTPLDVALKELERRANDPELKAKVEKYLEYDVPEHFTDGPILYLARHVATPNFETLRFLHLVEPLHYPAVIGQDVQDKFVAHNQLKKALGKVPVSLGISQKDAKYHERYENVTIIDFNTSNGRSFDSILTQWGEPIHDFHSRLFSEITKTPIRIVNDSEWITRQHRGKLVEHYKKFLSLFIVHGILFEDYSVEDREELDFIKNILEPAFRHVERHFGVKPLIAQLTPTSIESAQYWISYPKEVLGVIERSRNTLSTDARVHTPKGNTL